VLDDKVLLTVGEVDFSQLIALNIDSVPNWILSVLKLYCIFC
jgi:hypothetical protein